MDMTMSSPTEQAILEALKRNECYMTVAHLARLSGSPAETVAAFIAANPDKIRKSRMETEAGESLYILNTPLSGVADTWAAFRYFNSLKF